MYWQSPEGMLSTEIARNALPSKDPLHLRNPPGNEYLFGFASLPEAAIREGVRRLAD